MTGTRDRKEDTRRHPGGPYAVVRAMLGREPDRGVRERIEKVRSTLNARDDDAIWIVIAIFESAIDRAQRVYRLYIRCLIIAASLGIAVQIASVYATGTWLRSDETAMRTAVVGAIQQAACGGIGDEDACEIARLNAATPARRAVSSVVSRLPDDLVNALASTPNLAQWLTWMSASQVNAVAQSTAEIRKTGKPRDGR